MFNRYTALFVVIASMVGSGILTTTGFILAEVPDPFWNLVLWVLGGILSLTGAFTLAEVATAYPQTGGDYIFVREAFGKRWSFTYGWATLLIGYAAPIALIASSCASYLISFVAPDLEAAIKSTAVLAVASTIITVITFIHCRSHRESSWLQDSSTAFKVIIFFGIAIAIFSSDAFNAAQVVSSEHSRTFAVTSLGLALIQVMYAYTGWNAAIYIAAELPRPQKTIPFALVWGCLFVAVLYVTLNVAYQSVLPLNEIIAFSDDDKVRIAELALVRATDPTVAKAISFLISLGMIASVSAFILVGPRVAFAMASDGLAFRSWTKVHDQHRTPRSAVLAIGAMSLMFLWSGTYESLLNTTGYGLGVLALLSCLCIFPLRRRADYRPTFRCPWYPFTPILFVLLSIAMLLSAGMASPKSSAISVAWVLSGLFLFPFFNSAGSTKS
jgi:APA family basic amino acid/polyamine antiporter